MPSAITAKMSEIFTAVQYDRTCHQNYIKKMRKYYDKVKLEEFVEEFLANLQIPLTYIEKHPHVENALQFAARFAISLQPQNETEDEFEEICPLLEQIFEFLLKHHGSKEVAVRFRVCYFLNMILDTMGDNASIDDELCNRILQSMTDRILDKSPKVRAQAAIALHRLQEPNNKDCSVINVYLFHLAKDPSAEVRRVILAKMAKNKMTLQAAIKRTRDVDDGVRKMAYLFISKITVKSLTISQREHLINHGLQDRSENVKRCVRDVLVPAWLRYYDKQYISFIKAIDAEHAEETATLALNCLFKSANIANLVEQLPVDNRKFIPHDQLNSETILYWRCLAEFLKTENCVDEFEQIMPELSPFCGFIKDYVALVNSRQNKIDELSHQFVLHQLFEMVKLYDLSDEAGRRTLKELILESLQTYYCSDKISKCIVQYFEKVVPDANSRISLLVEVINEIRMPTRTNVVVPMSEDERHERKMQKAKLGMKLLELEDEEYSAIQRKDYAAAQAISEQVALLKEEIEALSKEPEIVETQNPQEEKNDPETMLQCLQIMYYMMQSNSIQVLTPTLRTLMDSIALPFINLHTNTNDRVLSLALKCVGLCCHVDKDLAKKYLMMYFLYISESSNEEVWVTATEVIFDLLLKYGFEHFNITHENDVNSTQNGKKSVRLYSHNDEDINVNEKQISCTDGTNNVIKALMAMLDNPAEKLQSVTAEGLCKLVLHKRISSHQLISQLLILWHNPDVKENAYLTQSLVDFFNLYIYKVSESQSILEEAYLPTLKALVNVSEMSKLRDIDLLRVSEVIISLTCCAIHNNYSVHNQLAYTILSEILNEDTEIPIDILIKSLKYLDVNLDGQNLKNDILKALDDVEEQLNQSGEKRTLLNNVYQFRTKITAARIDQTAETENGENPENQAPNQDEHEDDEVNENELEANHESDASR